MTGMNRQVRPRSSLTGNSVSQRRQAEKASASAAQQAQCGDRRLAQKNRRSAGLNKAAHSQDRHGKNRFAKISEPAEAEQSNGQSTRPNEVAMVKKYMIRRFQTSFQTCSCFRARADACAGVSTGSCRVAISFCRKSRPRSARECRLAYERIPTLSKQRL